MNIPQIRWVASQRILSVRMATRIRFNLIAFRIEEHFGISPYYRMSRCGVRSVLARLSLDAALWLYKHGYPSFGYAVAFPARIWK